MSQILTGTLIARLTNTGRRKQQAEAAVARYRSHMVELIVEGHGEGFSARQLAEAAGISRQAVEAILKGNR